MKWKYRKASDRQWLKQLPLKRRLEMIRKEKKEFLPERPIRHWGYSTCLHYTFVVYKGRVSS